MKELIIAIDGPVGSGKSTVARRVAEMMGYVYIDTGAMYRSVALKALRRGMSFDADTAPNRTILLPRSRATRALTFASKNGAQQVFLDGEDVTARFARPKLRRQPRKWRSFPACAKCWWPSRRRAGEKGGVVMEGRDIGSVVFPDAQLKIFLTASPEIRAERRWREHQQKGDAIDLPRTLEEIHERDRRDRERKTSPLVQAADAVVVDSTAMEPEEVARLVVMLAKGKSAAHAT